MKVSYGCGNSKGENRNDFGDIVPGYVVGYVPGPAVVGSLVLGVFIILHRRRRRQF